MSQHVAPIQAPMQSATRPMKSELSVRWEPKTLNKATPAFELCHKIQRVSEEKREIALFGELR